MNLTANTKNKRQITLTPSRSSSVIQSQFHRTVTRATSHAHTSFLSIIFHNWFNRLYFVLFCLHVGAVNSGMSTEREIIRDDMDVTRTLLKEAIEHLHKLEAKVSKFHFNR